MISVIRGLLAALVLACSLAAQGQTIVQNNGNGAYLGQAVGQSFVATLNGQITAISVRSMNHVTATLRIYTGGQGSGISGAVGTPAYLDPVIFDIPASVGGVFTPAGGFVTLTLTTPFSVTAGHTFTFLLASDSVINMAAQSGNPYTPGRGITNFADPAPFNFDAAFQIFESVVAPPAPAATPAAIPTLGEWALLGLMGLMAWLTARQMRRRR